MSSSWTPEKASKVTCTHCDYEWLYKGMTPYAQCPSCQRSNNLLGDD